MSREPDQQPDVMRLSRRELLRSAALGGTGLLGAYLVACKSGGSRATPTATTPTVEIATLASSVMRWMQLSPAGALPAARHDHSFVGDGQRLYLFGGRGPNAMADFWTYDLASNAWAAITASGPQPRFGHNAIWDSDRSRLVVFGGQDGRNFFNDVWEFDPSASTWTQASVAGSAPAARYGAGAAFDQAGHMLISHGFTTQGRFDDTWRYDLAAQSWTDVSPLDRRPLKRCLMRGVWDSLKQRLIIFAGQTDATPFLDDLWAWQPETNWQALARTPHPAARTFYAMLFHNRGAQIILFGGNTAAGPINDLWSFHSNGENWTPIPTTGDAPAPRYGHDAALVSETPSVFVFGGTDGKQSFDDLWSLAPAG